ncbi:hypothetical protein EC957_011808 [Mortierella hygrophila]|uniref:Uncharacterized protein n=1 Tax=Mortierella hygrophila TaxID=979708 RepID=A0A9P6EVI8_9FUNG|nr:hypothetical protein EC957_011808 [Mortierella hygrophila]
MNTTSSRTRLKRQSSINLDDQSPRCRVRTENSSESPKAHNNFASPSTSTATTASSGTINTHATRSATRAHAATIAATTSTSCVIGEPPRIDDFGGINFTSDLDTFKGGGTHEKGGGTHEEDERENATEEVEEEEAEAEDREEVIADNYGDGLVEVSPSSYAAEYRPKKRGKAPTESYEALMDRMVYMGTQLLTPDVNTDQQMSAVERKEASVMEEIKTQGANIAKATKDAYRPVLAAFKAFCEKEYSGESGQYDVTETKICVFFTGYLFKTTTQKHIYTNRFKDRTIFMFRDDVRSRGVMIWIDYRVQLSPRITGMMRCPDGLSMYPTDRAKSIKLSRASFICKCCKELDQSVPVKYPLWL